MTDERLRLAADDNLAAHAMLPCRVLPRAWVITDPALTLVDSGIPCDTFNIVCRARLDVANAARRITHALDLYQETGHPFSWWLGPGATPAELPELLGRAGLVAAESELAMALDLARLPAASPAGPDGLRVTRVRTAEDLATFAALSAANWDPPDQSVTRFYRDTSTAFLDPASPQWLYLGWLDGAAVATAEVTVGGGVAGLYNIGTRPQYRGRRIGSVMTWAPLREAREAGLDTAILQASEMGQGLYARLGFRPFGTITEFKPAPSGTGS